MRIILASASPRRKELLEQVGIKFEIITSQASEEIELMPPYDYVKELSRRKARAVFDMLKEKGEDLSDCVIIGADTVVYHKGEILTKPKDKEDAPKEDNTALLAILSQMENNLKTTLGTKVKIKPRGKNKGRIEIEYFSSDDLERIIHIINTKEQI